MDKCLINNTVVGLDIVNDLASLNYKHNIVEDLKDYYKDKNGQAYSLKFLANKVLQKTAFQKSEHSAITDARITALLDKKKTDVMAKKCFWFDLDHRQ